MCLDASGVLISNFLDIEDLDILILNVVVSSHLLIHLVYGAGSSGLADFAVHAMLASSAPVVEQDTIGVDIGVVFMHLSHGDELSSRTLDFVLLVHAMPEA